MIIMIINNDDQWLHFIKGKQCMFMKVACYAGMTRESCLSSQHGCSARRTTYSRGTVIIICDAIVSVPSP